MSTYSTLLADRPNQIFADLKVQGIATMFAKAKAQAIGICARTTSELEETKREILDTDPDCKVYLQQVDVTHENEVKSFFDAICEAYGKVDICISNAGAASGFKPVEQSETDAWWNDVVSTFTASV